MFKDKILKTIYIEGMSCGHCAKSVEDKLKKLKEIKSVKVDLENKKADICLKSSIDDEIIKNSIEEIGFKVNKIIDNQK